MNKIKYKSKKTTQKKGRTSFNGVFFALFLVLEFFPWKFTGDVHFLILVHLKRFPSFNLYLPPLIWSFQIKKILNWKNPKLLFKFYLIKSKIIGKNKLLSTKSFPGSGSSLLEKRISFEQFLGILFITSFISWYNVLYNWHFVFQKMISLSVSENQLL